MTRVLFYSDIADKQHALTMLVEKALAKKHGITIMTEGEQAAKQYSKTLWKSDREHFLPNVLASHMLEHETPVVLDWQENRLCQDDI